MIGHWADEARCVDAGPDTFFPEGYPERIVARAKRICAMCPVQKECLNEAIATNTEYGIWGGMTPTERTLEIRRRDLQRQKNSIFN